ncbi:sugar kinase, partial [Streptomyces lavendulocolor]
MRVRSGRTVRDLRRENRTAVLQRLYFDGPLSRFSLGPATGLSSGSISNVVAELVAE